eukprot:TRINITY_DN2883_c0_g1_i1.p1 TRINITY_DN2883_c0_g1~~TRINITY_DN2883_c0_g1_i1.p1  ORF type:complete len:145 (-),score=14.94 TRINITY_DN2883_c0_g1_i1:42-476(-)
MELTLTKLKIFVFLICNLSIEQSSQKGEERKDPSNMKLMVGYMKDLQNTFETLTNKLNGETNKNKNPVYSEESSYEEYDEDYYVASIENTVGPVDYDPITGRKACARCDEPWAYHGRDAPKTKLDEILRQSASMMENLNSLQNT